MPIGIKGFQKGNKSWDNFSTKKHWFKRGQPSQNKGKRLEEICGTERAKELKEQLKKYRFKKGMIPWNKGLTKETNELVRKVAEKNLGKKVPEGLYPNAGMRNKKHSKKAKDKMCLAKKGKYFGKDNPFFGKKHTEETKLKLRKPKSEKHKKKLRLSHIGLKQSKETIEKRAEKNRELWKDDKYRERIIKSQIIGRKPKPNKPEQFLNNLIKKNNLPFNYVGDGQIIIGGFNPDFLSKNPKQIIELFGDYWHNKLGVKNRDKRRFKTYKKFGYKTLVIWEHELVSGKRYGKQLTEQRIVKKIKNFIK